MTTSALHLTIPIELVFPEDWRKDAHCLQKVGAMLEGERGISQVHIDQIHEKNSFCIHYNPAQLTLKQLSARIKLAGLKIAKQFHHKTLAINNLNSPDAAQTLEHALKALPGIISANVSYASETIRLEYNTQAINLKRIQQCLASLGVTIRDEEKELSWVKRYRQLLFSLTAGLLLFIAWPVEYYSPSISLALIWGAMIFGGVYACIDAFHTLRQGRFDIEVLMVGAAFGAGILGNWSEGALLLFLFSFGHSLEHVAMDRARRSVKALAALTPKTAVVKRGDGRETVRISDLIRGDIVYIEPGQAISTDGEIIEGASAINQASITGESLPVEKVVGDEVYAGTINGEGVLAVNVTKLSTETTLSRMIKMVTAADTQKSPTQYFAERFQRYYVPITLCSVFLLAILPPFITSMTWSASIYRALSVLVAASPCALALATPAAILSGIARAAQNGILIKGGTYLEVLAKVRAIAFDKTGTLTEGKPAVSDIITLTGSEDELLMIAAAIETYSQHPLASAIVNAAKQRQLTIPDADAIQSVTGKGIYGNVNEKPVEIGSVKLFDDLSPEAKDAVIRLQDKGCTVMVVRYNQQFIGVIGLTDIIRSNTPNVLKQLNACGIEKTIMLTGDNQRAADNIAKEIGMSEVYAELLPEDKLTAMKALEQKYHFIAMVGDGVNDAPAMARASVGFAMGGAGTDVALEAADIALMKDDLSKLPFAIGLSRSTRSIISQNLFISLGIVPILIIATLTGFMNIGLIVAIHEGSSLVVVCNALRLLRFKRKAS